MMVSIAILHTTFYTTLTAILLKAHKQCVFAESTTSGKEIKQHVPQSLGEVVLPAPSHHRGRTEVVPLAGQLQEPEHSPPTTGAVPRLCPSQVSCRNRNTAHVNTSSCMFFSPAAPSEPTPRPSALVFRSNASRSRTLPAAAAAVGGQGGHGSQWEVTGSGGVTAPGQDGRGVSPGRMRPPGQELYGYRLQKTR